MAFSEVFLKLFPVGLHSFVSDILLLDVSDIFIQIPSFPPGLWSLLCRGVGLDYAAW